MKIEEYQEQINLLKQEQDETKRAQILMGLEHDYKAQLNIIQETQDNLKKVTSERDNYAVLNNKLWLERNNSSETETETNKDDEQPNKRSYADLKF